jgi:hypothetical protein
MNDDERLEDLIRSVLPPVAAVQPTRDLWPLVVRRGQALPAWSWVDVGLAAALAIVLLVFPRLLLVLVYHL